MINPKTISVIGYGAVGRIKAEMFHKVFQDAKILAYDTQKLENVPDYVRVVGSVDEAIRGSDLIIHAQSASGMVGAIDGTLGIERSTKSIELHCCSIQEPAYQALRRVSGRWGHTVLGAHLMTLPPKDTDGLNGKRIVWTTTEDKELHTAQDLACKFSGYGLNFKYLEPTDHDKGTGVTQGFSLASVAVTGLIFAQNPENAYFPFITDGEKIEEEYAMRLDGRLALMSLGRFAKVSPDTIASIICLNPYVHDFVSLYRDKRRKLLADMGDLVEDRYQQAREFVGKELLDTAMMIRKRFARSSKRSDALMRYPGEGSGLSLIAAEVEEPLDWKSFEGAKIMKRISLADAIAFTETMQESELSLEDVGFAATTGYDLKLAGIAEALCNKKLEFPAGPLATPLPSDFDTATLVLDIILGSQSDGQEKIQSVIDGYITPCVESFPLYLRKRWFEESEELLSWKEAS